MSKNFHEQYSIEQKAPSERGTGFVFAGIAALAAYWWWHNTIALVVALSLCSFFLVTALFAPAVLRPINAAWFQFAMFLSKITNPIVMFMLFLVVIVPAGLVMQMRRDPLRKRRQPARATYWIERSGNTPVTSMTNQF